MAPCSLCIMNQRNRPINSLFVSGFCFLTQDARFPATNYSAYAIVSTYYIPAKKASIVRWLHVSALSSDSHMFDRWCNSDGERELKNELDAVIYVTFCRILGGFANQERSFLSQETLRMSKRFDHCSARMCMRIEKLVDLDNTNSFNAQVMKRDLLA